VTLEKTQKLTQETRQELGDSENLLNNLLNFEICLRAEERFLSIYSDDEFFKQFTFINAHTGLYRILGVMQDSFFRQMVAFQVLKLTARESGDCLV
jgi:hypothetical protein